MRRLAVLALLLVAPPAFAQKEFGFDNRKASGQPYLSPDETVARMKVAPEFEVKLFAGEPLLANPIAFTIDEKGRVWAIECFEYPSRTPPGKMPRDRIVILEDTDGDGKADTRTVFAEGKDFPERFDMASGLEVGHGGVYVGAPPHLWFIENKNDKPGKFEKLASGFGSQDTHETLNTFQWGPDGWLYGLHGVFTQSNVKPQDGPELRMNAAVWRFHPKSKTFEVFAEGTSNPWGMDWRNTDGQFILACCVIPHLYHIVPGGIYKRQAGTSYNPHAYGQINEICDHTFHRESGWAHAGLISLDVPHMPERYRDSVIFGSIHGCSIKQNVLKSKGSSFVASRGDDFLVSGDKNFRPINLKWGPNGDIYLIDWHDQNPCHQAKADSWDYERGRVYRIQLKGRPAKKAEDLSRLTEKELQLATVALNDPAVGHPWRRRTALRLLQERAGRLSERFRLDMAGMTTYYNLFALYGLIGTGHDVSEFLRFVRDERTAGGPEIGTAIGAAVVRGLADRPLSAEQFRKLVALPAQHTTPAQRRELASAAIRLSDKHDVAPLLRALMARTEDANDPQIPHLVWLAYEKVITRAAGGQSPADAELDWLAEQAPSNVFVRDQIVPKVTRRLASTGKPDDLARCVAFLSKVKDANTRQKALDGLAVALADQQLDAPAGWADLRKDLLAMNDARITPLANKLAVSFRDPEAVKRALGVLIDPATGTDARTQAARELAQLKAKEARVLFPRVIANDPDAKVRAEAARGLAVFDDAKIPGELLAGWKDHPPAVRAEVVNTLAGRKEWAKTLLLALQAKTIDRTAVTDNTITRIQGFNDAGLNKLIEEAWGRTRRTPAELEAVIGKLRGELAVGTGSFTKGKAVFEAQCAKCHQFDGRGAEVGPPLDGAGRDIEYLLANVLDPNRVIGAPYFVRQVNTQDGQLLQGVLAAEDDQSITLKVENGLLKRIAKADIDGPVKVLEKSMMPEGLAAAMTVQDFRDLVRYVMASPFPATATVNGKPTPVPVSGRVPLPGGTVRVTFEVTAAADVTTQLLVGSADPFEVSVDGAQVGGGAGQGRAADPDREAVPVKLAKGTHTLTLTLTGKAAGGLYARLLDPDRKLTDPEGK